MFYFGYYDEREEIITDEMEAAGEAIAAGVREKVAERLESFEFDYGLAETNDDDDDVFPGWVYPFYVAVGEDMAYCDAATGTIEEQVDFLFEQLVSYF